MVFSMKIYNMIEETVCKTSRNYIDKLFTVST